MKPRTTRSRCGPFGAILLIAMLCFVASPGSGAPREGSPTDSLEAEIDSLRYAAAYEEAVQEARALLAYLRSDTATKPYQVAAAERLIGTLELTAALPESAREELAEADQLTEELEEAYGRGDYASGEQHARRQLEIRRKLLGDEHPDVAESLNNLAHLLQARGDFAGAESLSRESHAMRRKLLGDEHPDVATSLNNLASLLQARGDYAGAESLSRESLAMRRRLLGDEHPSVAITLNNLAGLLRLLGDYAGAEPLFRESLAMKRKLLGDEHPSVATSLNNLALLLQARGDYAGAEPLCRASLAMWRKLLGDEHPNVATSLLNLAHILRARGDYAGAELLVRESLAMDHKLLGDEHPDVAISLGNLAVLLQARGDYAGAESLYRESLAMRRKLLGDEHPSVATSLNNLANLLQNTGDYAGAEPLYREALAMRRKLLGNEHPRVATVLNNFANLLQDLGDYAGAEPLVRESLAMRRKLLGNEHADVAISLLSLAHLLQARGDHAGAEPLLTQAAAVFDAARLRVGTGMKRAAFSEQSPYPSLAATRLALGNGAEAWLAVERSQGRVLADLLMITESRELLPAEAKQEKAIRLALGDRERELKAFREVTRVDNSAEARKKVEGARTRLLEAEVEWGALQQEITVRHPVTEGQAFALSRVQKSLAPHEAIVGWLDISGGTKQKPKKKSWGYVIRDKGPVRWENLVLSAVGESSSGTGTGRSTAKAYLRAVTNSTRAVRGDTGYLADGRALYRERIAPLMPHLEGVRDLIVLPSGVMLGVPVETLPIEDSNLMAERFTISYTPSATIHTWLTEKAPGAEAPSRDRFLLVGDPPFAEAHLAAMEKEDEGELDEVLPGAAEGLPDPDLVRSVLAGNTAALSSLRRLPGTREEVTRVGFLASEARVLLGRDASEQVLVSMAESGELRGFGTIHIATHGLVDDERPERSALVLSLVDLPDPLEAALAGTRIYDGLLTAGEILREWELEADLVTLSACETGLGKEISGEGLVGFAHAFLQAGARSLLVSLWAVPDRATSLLMQRFYENRLGSYSDERSELAGEAMSKAEALREAKRWLREYRAEGGGQPYEHPYFWSGFILIGTAE